MIIDRQYIIDRMVYWTSEKHDMCFQHKKHKGESINTKLINIKYSLPRWARSILINPYNPVYILWNKFKHTIQYNTIQYNTIQYNTA